MEQNVFSGKINFRNVEFSFNYSNKILSLIPPDNEKENVHYWDHQKLEHGYTNPGPSITIDGVLVGEIYESNRYVIFLSKYDTFSKNNYILKVEISYYIVVNDINSKISKMSFAGPELEKIYPINSFIGINTDNFDKTGEADIHIPPFNETNTKPKYFDFENKKVGFYYAVSRKISFTFGEQPIELTPYFQFIFDETDDFEFLIKLYFQYKKYIQFLSYRKNVTINNVELFEKRDDKYYKAGSLYSEEIIKNPDEYKNLRPQKYLSYNYFANFDVKIMNMLSENILYINHISETYEEYRSFTIADFIFVVSAFDWEFRQSYPDKIQKELSENDQIIKDELVSFKEEKNRKIREKVDHLIDSLSYTNMASRIRYVFEDNKDSINSFAKTLYGLNKVKFDYKDMAQKVAQQRNDFAHGNIDKTIYDDAFLGAMLLEKIVRFMQLKRIGLDDKYICEYIKLS